MDIPDQTGRAVVITGAAGLDDDVAKRLWAVSEELTGVPFAVGAV